MALYRLFLVDDAGRYLRFVELAADDDAHAVRQASRVAGQGSLELWRGGSFVCRLDPQARSGRREPQAAPPVDAVEPKAGAGG